MAGSPPKMIGWTLRIQNIGAPPTGATTETVYWWSGENDITVNGQTYKGVQKDGAAFLSISAIEQGQGPPSERATVRMAVVPEITRRLLQQDYGPLPMRIGWVTSSDGGRSWTALPRSFSGRLSSPRLLDGIYEAEIETVLGDSDRGKPYRWSYEAYLDRHNDKFFEAVRSYASGITSSWPP